MRVRHPSAILLILVALAAQSPALAAGPSGSMRDFRSVIERMKEGAFTLAPFAAVKFCVANRDQCEDTGGGEIIDLTDDRRQQLLAVNSGINRAIKPISDGLKSDVWSVDVDSGDCEDYALTKRKHLLKLGWSSRALRIAVAKTSAGEGHAVLIVKTSVGDMVLDNRTSIVREWKKTDLRWIKIQSGQNPNLWVNIASHNPDLRLVSE